MSKKIKNLDNPALAFISSANNDLETQEPQTQTPAPTPARKSRNKKRETRSERLNTLTTPTILNDLRTIANDYDISVNELVNSIFIEYIEREKK